MKWIKTQTEYVITATFQTFAYGHISTSYETRRFINRADAMNHYNSRRENSDYIDVDITRHSIEKGID